MENRIGITGSTGFIGDNLFHYLKDTGYPVERLKRDQENGEFKTIIHCSGVNRPKDGNYKANYKHLDTIINTYPESNVLYLSSVKASKNSSYGVSKLLGEKIAESKGKDYIRLPNVFGKWAKPDYNSFVATFCHNRLNYIELEVTENEDVELLFIDDLCKGIEKYMNGYEIEFRTHRTTVNQVKEIIENINPYSVNLPVGLSDFEKRIWSTLLSYSKIRKHKLNTHQDNRGLFAEIVKGEGQFSLNICNPKESKGDHYHHYKFERFIQLSGKSKVLFDDIRSGEKTIINLNPYEYIDVPSGVNHIVTNEQNEKSIFAIYSPFVYDPKNKDTYVRK